MKQLESDVENRVVRWARQRNIPCTKLNLQLNRGWPDRVFWILGGSPVLIEFKRLGARPRPLQQYVIDQLTSLGYNVYATSSYTEAVTWITEAVEKANTTRRRRPRTP